MTTMVVFSSKRRTTHCRPGEFRNRLRNFLFPALDLINSLSAQNEDSGFLQRPRGAPAEHARAMKAIEEAASRTRPLQGAVVSFDIDLTLDTGELEDQGMTLVPVRTIRELQEMGHIAGTCSDRDPSDQLQTLEELGITPDFRMPKEMLKWARVMLPAHRHLHVGDDPRRDQDMAREAGWEHMWPAEFLENYPKFHPTEEATPVCPRHTST